MNIARAVICPKRIARNDNHFFSKVLGSRCFNSRDSEIISHTTRVPNEMDLAMRKARWQRAFAENEPLFNKLVRSLKIHKDKPRTIPSLETLLSYHDVRMWVKKFNKSNDIEGQCFLVDRHETLGNEVAAAHFVVYRGGRVKFHGQDFWIKTKKGEDYDENLPKNFDPSVFLDGIDVEGMKLYYEGLENLKGLARLRSLSLKNSPLIDDWCLDRISGDFSSSLEYLDISNCKKVSYHGISCLYRLEKLKILKVENIADSVLFQLSCLMLEEINPNLVIEGVKYLEIEQQKN